ncbi:zinc finger BED domain-containing protein 4-like [Spodoptera litura]|uniref:Zinc finger BED domain-containing protein 4-like n=2 Tax=Spodoptera litura TaxID=69820 RepID=A0A9J7ERB9_SPOLT|nr:zinc finger BED domain-containing protein 4-like [Spodoptera litura]
MSGRKRSRAWDFFDEMEDDKTKVKCTLCSSVISRGGTGRTASTSGMTNHLKLKHKDQLPETSSTSVSAPEHSFDTLPTTSSVKSNKQQTLEEAFVTKWDINDSRAKEIHNAIAEMIATDNQPISILENKGFDRLLHLLKPKYKLPGRKYMSEVVIPAIYERVKKLIKDEISKANAVSITSDMWTCMNNMLCFLSFTAHWLNEDFILQHRVLQMKHFVGSHSGNQIRSVLEELASTWGISSLIHVIVRDNGPNMVKAIKESAFEGKGCFIHTLQLAIKAALEVENVSDALISARRIVTHFNHSSTAQQKLKDIQKELHLTEHQLVQDVTTRWNSTYYMLERVVEQKRAISLYISDNSGSVNIRNCTERQWQILKECLILLKPFEEITKITSSTFSTISEVIPHSNTLIKYLTKPEISEEDKYYCLSTLLDPRFRTRFFAQENYELVRRKLFLEAIQRSDLDAESSSEDEATNRGRPPQNVSNFLEESHVTFWNCYEELASTNPVISEDPKSPIAVELNNYESESLLPRNQSPFDWWAKHKSKYAHLANLARVFLSAPGSSVYSERLFSEAGNLYEEKRNRLLPERAESLVFLHHNLPLINYKY